MTYTLTIQNEATDYPTLRDARQAIQGYARSHGMKLWWRSFTGRDLIHAGSLDANGRTVAKWTIRSNYTSRHARNIIAW